MKAAKSVGHNLNNNNKSRQHYIVDNENDDG